MKGFQIFSCTSLPNGVRDSPAILKCCLANGIPMMVMKRRIPKKICVSHAQSPPKIIQIRFIGIRMHPVGPSVLLTSAPNGHRHNSPILKVCRANGMPMMVTASARLPVK